MFEKCDSNHVHFFLFACIELFAENHLTTIKTHWVFWYMPGCFKHGNYVAHTLVHW